MEQVKLKPAFESVRADVVSIFGGCSESLSASLAKHPLK